MRSLAPALTAAIVPALAVALAAGHAEAGYTEPGTAGYDGGFVIRTPEGNSLRIGGYMQFRYVLNHTDNPTIGDDELATGFVMRRAKINFEGAAAGGALDYKITLRANSLGFFTAEDVWAAHTFDNGLTLKAGQFKLQQLREETVSGSAQLCADRSLVNRRFSAEYSQGVQLSGMMGDTSRWAVAFSDGAVQRNTPTFTEFNDYALTAKFEHCPSGAFKRFKDFTSFRGENDARTDTLYGGSLHYQSGGQTAGPFNMDRHQLTGSLEASVEGDGWNAFTTAIAQWVDPGGAPDYVDYGLLAQAGYFVSERTEIFARGDALINDEDSPRPDNFSAVTAGANFYPIAGSGAAKFTADFIWFLAGTNGALLAPAPNDGLRASPTAGQYALRLQVLLKF